MNNINPNKKIELLAPAKNLEYGIAAINCGADAIYMGSSKFGARVKAGNSLNDIKKISDYVHKYYCKIYITLNTILYDNEIDEVIKLCHSLYDIGVDGLIIQDMGLLEFDLPPIPIIASTQTFCNTPEKVRFLNKIGIKRAILPRELNIAQIENIHSLTPDIEH